MAKCTVSICVTFYKWAQKFSQAKEREPNAKNQLNSMKSKTLCDTIRQWRMKAKTMTVTWAFRI